jgi:hypothetical protein
MSENRATRRRGARAAKAVDNGSAPTVTRYLTRDELLRMRPPTAEFEFSGRLVKVRGLTSSEVNEISKRVRTRTRRPDGTVDEQTDDLLDAMLTTLYGLTSPKIRPAAGEDLDEALERVRGLPQSLVLIATAKITALTMSDQVRLADADEPDEGDGADTPEPVAEEVEA